MRQIGVLAVSATAILAAGTMSADAFGGHGGGRGFGGGHGGYGPGLAFGLAGAGLGYGLGYGYGGYYPGYAYGYGDPGYYGYGAYNDPGYGYGDTGYGVGYAPQYSRPLQTGRSSAMGGFGKYCATPVKTCTLYNPSSIGADCSCKVSVGRARGNVAP